MGRKQLSIAKITRPTLPAVFPRERLFRLVDERLQSRAIWISGPPGSGKTTLIASYLESRDIPCIWYQVDAGDADIATFFYYLGLAAQKAAPRSRKPLPLLTPEYLMDVPTFSRRYFENLCSRAKPPVLIVFDNYQEVPAESPFHEILHAGLSSIPDGIHVIVISRAEPSPAFAGMMAGNRLAQIGWEELRLTDEESEGIALLHLGEKESRTVRHWMRDTTGGWAAGLILLSKFMKREVLDPRTLSADSLENIFDYFANELFDRRTDEVLKDFLLRTSVLPKMTPSVAERLTGNHEAGRILAELNRRNYFTEKRHHPQLTYQYHPLFREFLLARAMKTFSPGEISRLRSGGARLMEEYGQIEDAAALFIATESWGDLARLVAGHGQAMITQGRHATLRQWIERMPAAERDKTASVLYWHAHSLVPVQPDVSKDLFERAFVLFSRQQDRAGMFRALSNAADMSLQEGSFVYLDRQIALLNGMLREDPSFPSPEIKERVTISMFNALSMRQPWSAVRNRWDARALACLRQSADKSLRISAGVYLVIFHFYMGNMSRAADMVQSLRDEVRAGDVSPLLAITVKTGEAIFSYVTADFDASLKAVDEGLRLARETGIHIWDNHLLGNGCGAALSMGEMDRAESYLRRMADVRHRERRFDHAYYRFMKGWYRLLKGEPDRALEEISILQELMPEVGFIYGEFFCSVLMAQVRHELGDDKQALTFLEKSKKLAGRIGSKWLISTELFAEAHMQFDRAAVGAETMRGVHARHGMACLRKALAICKERGIWNTLGWRPSVMTSLLARALEAGIETAYVKELIRKRNLMPEQPPLHIESWPWPVKVYTLGRFRIDVDERPLEFPGKAQKKPLEMLKVLIALGGREVGQEQITETLWPDAEGDHAHKSFEMTLQRLRRMLGRDEAVKLQGGQVSLDVRLCWTDVGAFDRLLTDADQQSGGDGTHRRKKAAGTHREIPGPVEKAIRLYQGHFLPDDGHKPWSVAMRERLRSRFLRLIVRTGESLEQARQWQKAVEFYERGIETDALAEELYQRIMACHQRLGQEAQVVMIYQRCKTALLRNLGVAPSSKTEAIYRQALRERR